MPKIIKEKQITAAEKAKVVACIKKCFRELAKKKHELKDRQGNPVTATQMWNDLPEIKIGNYKVSRAGASRIIIGLHCHWFLGNKVTEYRSFSKDPVIGDAQLQSFDDTLLCLVAHEVSHHIQYRYGPSTGWLRSIYRKPHGDGFKAIYAILRGSLVNPLSELEKQPEAACRRV